jgi:hypothetical protein
MDGKAGRQAGRICLLWPLAPWLLIDSDDALPCCNISQLASCHHSSRHASFEIVAEFREVGYASTPQAAAS